MQWTDKMIDEKIASLKKTETKKEVCPQCGSENYIKAEGCSICQDCQYSPCRG